MDGWERTKLGTAVTLACAAVAGAWWIGAQLMAPVYPSRYGYPIQGVPPVDLATAQREWPVGAQTLEWPQLFGYIRNIEHATPPAVTDAATAPAAPVPTLDVLLAAAQPDRGRRTAQVCMACHDVTRGGANGIGPNLWGVVGRPVAGHGGFAYSAAMRGHGGAWSYATLDQFLARPNQAVPGTKMAFAGIRNPRERANLLAFLGSLGSPEPAR